MRATGAIEKRKRRFVDFSQLEGEKVIDFEAYRAAVAVYWHNAFYDNDVPFETIYRAVLELLQGYRGRATSEES